jgi:hypothetical protein
MTDDPIDGRLLPVDPDQAERIASHHWRRADEVRDLAPEEAAKLDAQADWYRRAARQLREEQK